MSTKHAMDESAHDEPLVKRDFPPPSSATVKPAGSPELTADFQTLARQVQDLKNACYHSLAPENQSRLDAAITTLTTIKTRYALG